MYTLTFENVQSLPWGSQFNAAKPILKGKFVPELPGEFQDLGLINPAGDICHLVQWQNWYGGFHFRVWKIVESDRMVLTSPVYSGACKKLKVLSDGSGIEIERKVVSGSTEREIVQFGSYSLGYALRFKEVGEVPGCSPHRLANVDLHGDWVPELPGYAFYAKGEVTRDGNRCFLVEWVEARKEAPPSFRVCLIDGVAKAVLRSTPIEGCCYGIKLISDESGVQVSTWNSDKLTSQKITEFT